MTSPALKTDLFGTIRMEKFDGRDCVVRDFGTARWWLKPLAARLARREARALLALAGMPGVPRLLRLERGRLVRSYLPGVPMQRARPQDAAYYREALRLLVRMHRAGVAHNDLAKEPNWLVTPDGRPALVDFQLATVSPRRGPMFRILAREDVRHLLKHKRTYRSGHLTGRQQRMLSTPSGLSRLWKATGKQAYLFVTRGVLGWADREGAGDRRLP